MPKMAGRNVFWRTLANIMAGRKLRRKWREDANAECPLTADRQLAADCRTPTADADKEVQVQGAGWC